MNNEYNNPIPVAVVLVPVLSDIKIDIGIDKPNIIEMPIIELLYIRRNIEPKKGMLALPGGFVNEKENIETGAIRELEEETGIKLKELNKSELSLLKSEITPGNQVLVFCKTQYFEKNEIEPLLTLNKEVSGFVISGVNEKFAFPLHEKIINEYLSQNNSNIALDIPLSNEERNILFKKLVNMNYIKEEFINNFLKQKKFKI